MTNVVAMTSETAMAPLARWLLGFALVACVGQRDEAVFLLDPDLVVLLVGARAGLLE